MAELTTAERLLWARRMEARAQSLRLKKMQRIYTRLAIADKKTAKLVDGFIRRWKNTPWDKIPQSNVDGLIDRVNEALGEVRPDVERSIADAAQQRIVEMGDFGRNHNLLIGQMNVNRTWLRLRQDYVMTLVDRDTRYAVDTIKATLQRGWIDGDMAPGEIVTECRTAIGMTENLAETYRAAVKKTAGMASAARDRKIIELMKQQRTLAYKVDRIIRTENQRASNEIVDDWFEELNEKLGGGVVAEEFIPQADACDECQSLAGVYPLGEGPMPVDDTHPNCNCERLPVLEGEESAAKIGKPYRDAPKYPGLVGRRIRAVQAG